MSSYPPPTFGTPFNPNGHMEPPVGSRDHALPQYPYSYQNPPFLYGQGQPTGMPIVPHTNSNTHSFLSNAQDVTTHSSGNEVNGAPYTHYAGQIHHSAFQTPAYPPTSVAHDTPSYGARPSNQPSADSTSPLNSSTLFSNIHPAAAGAEFHSTNIEDSDTVPPALSDLEDGELDDGEAEKGTGQSRASTTTPSGVSQQKQHDDLESGHSGSTHRDLNAPDIPLPGLSQGSLATPKSQDSTVPQSQRYSMMNGFIDNSKDPQFLQTAKSTSIQHLLSTDTTAQESEEVSQRFADQKIEEAKQALRDLRSRGFDFNQIVNAGLNPDVLRKLYTKIEVALTDSSDLLQSKNVRPGSVDVPIKSAPGVATEGIHVKQLKRPQKDSSVDALGNEISPRLATEEVKINNQPTIATAKNEGKPVPSQASSAKSTKFLKSSSVNPLDKVSGVKAGEKKIVDRKEYIARMLAAKAGKPAVSATIPVISETITLIDSGEAAQVGSSAVAAATIPAIVQQPPSDEVDIAPGTQKEDLDAEAKRKAQTDLARQKIEALKHRENIQQARSATSNDMKNSQQNAANGAPNIPSERSVPAPRPLPSRQSSYFSPASQKPSFSIPGLFMTSDALHAANSSHPLANEGFAVSSQRVSHATFGSLQEGLRPHAVIPDAIIPAQSPTVDKISTLLEDSLVQKSALPATISTINSSNRKRQKASDFIDSPSTRVKRPLGQQEDTSVIIDISDDEVSNDTSGDESLKTENVACRQDSIPRKFQLIASGNGKERPIKSLPPLTDFPQRKKSVMMTPPAAQAPGQSGDLKGLKSKEMEIEAINRKIAELEQRIAIKARQTTSRNQSPGTSGRVTVSPPPGEASQHSPQYMRLSVSDSRNDDVTHLESPETFPAITEINKTAAAEGLNAEQQLEKVERAKAEAERSLAAEGSLISAADQSLTQEEKIQTPQAVEESVLQAGEQRSKDEEQKLVRDEEERRYEETQSQEARGEETKSIGQQEADRNRQQQEHRVVQGVPPQRLQEQERNKFLDNQRQARKSEIESGLPLLDAEVERTRTRLESLRQEIAGLETQLQKGIQGRQGLIEELNILSRSREALPGPTDFDSCDVSDVSKQSTSAEELPAVTKPSASVEMVPDLASMQLSGTVVNGRETQKRVYPMQTSDDRTSGGKIEEDIMDISRSDVGADPSLYSPKAVSEAQDTPNLIDDDENYEPPSEISIIQRQEPDPDAVLLYEDLQNVKPDLQAETQNQYPADQNAGLMENLTSGEPSSAASVNMAVDEQAQRSLSHSPSQAHASDPDDYEPPEPAPLGEEKPRLIRISSVDSEKSFSPPDVDTHDFVAHASSDSIPAVHQEVQKMYSNRKMGRFTPYESPLKQFKSFRYHPKYLEEVSSGFRSLTYSHTINPEIPLCRYELDGVCNDDSCQNQHLRSVGLSDDKILVDLGAKPDGSSPEFGNGLREIIHDIRSRKIRDFNIVAGEITAYRARFLGDSSKVLPL